MTVIEEMKEAKLRYLADTMKDYAKWLSETSQEQYTAERIKEYAESIEEVLAMNVGDLVAANTLDIRRLEDSIKFNPHDMLYDFNFTMDRVKQECIGNLQKIIKDLVKVKTHDEGEYKVITASIYVGVPPEKIEYINLRLSTPHP